MFVGRKRELNEIRAELLREKKGCILIYGRRRIGKSTLIAEALKEFDGKIIKYTAVPDELSENTERLSLAFSEALNLPEFPYRDLEKLLKYIARSNEKIALVIDEYQDLKKRANGEVVDAIFRDFVDLMPDNIKLILSGSAIRIMKSLLEYENPMFGRFSLVIPLGELNYLESSLFYPERSVREKIALYSVFGGLPIVLDKINKDLSVEDNIKNLMLNKTGIARSYVENNLVSELTQSGGAYSVLIRLANGKRTFTEIKNMLLDENSRNSLAYTLEKLVDSGFIDKKRPINDRNNKKNTFYEISINMLRFYVSYVEKRQSIASEEAYYNAYIEPSIDTFISYRFEKIVKDYFMLLVTKGKRNDIIQIGEYWYDNPKEKVNGEFDVALDTLNGYEIYEVKYYKDPISDALMDEEEAKIRKIKGLNALKIGFASSSGFKDTTKENLISAKDMYNLKLL